jgi:hypothetical protein
VYVTFRRGFDEGKAKSMNVTSDAPLNVIYTLLNKVAIEETDTTKTKNDMNELLKQWEQRQEELRIAQNNAKSSRGQALLSGKYLERRDALKQLKEFLVASEQSPVEPNEQAKEICKCGLPKTATSCRGTCMRTDCNMPCAN